MAAKHKLLLDRTSQLSLDASAEGVMRPEYFDSLKEALVKRFRDKVQVREGKTRSQLGFWLEFEVDSAPMAVRLTFERTRRKKVYAVGVETHAHWPMQRGDPESYALKESDLEGISLEDNLLAADHEALLFFTLPTEAYESVQPLPLNVDSPGEMPFDIVTGQSYVKKSADGHLYRAVVDWRDKYWFFSAEYKVRGRCGVALCTKALEMGVRVARLFVRRTDGE